MINPNDYPSLKYCMIGFLNYFGDARVRGYARLLRKAGCMVDVLGLHGLKTRVMVDEDGVNLISVPVSWTRKSRARYLLEYGLSFLYFIFLLTKFYFKNRYDVIHVHNMPDFLIFCAAIPKLFGAKLILDIHDPMPEVYMSKFPEHENSFLARLLRLEEKISISFADAVITANPHFKDTLVARGIPASKITTINNYPDPEIFHRSNYPAEKNKTHDQFTLIFPGTIAPRYGLEIAVRSVHILKDRIPNIHLLIIGKQDEHARSLISLSEQLGIASLVEIRDSMPHKKIPQQLLQADVGIYPALPDLHMSNAIPGKVLEFATMGLPIISSRLKIIEEMFGDSAVMFFEPGNIEDFANCVLRLYNNPPLCIELIHQADQMLDQRHSMEREIQAYKSLLIQLLPERSEIPGFWQGQQ